MCLFLKVRNVNLKTSGQISWSPREIELVTFCSCGEYNNELPEQNPGLRIPEI